MAWKCWSLDLVWKVAFCVTLWNGLARTEDLNVPHLECFLGKVNIMRVRWSYREISHVGKYY
jgi:hypothetical protein